MGFRNSLGFSVQFWDSVFGFGGIHCSVVGIQCWDSVFSLKLGFLQVLGFSVGIECWDSVLGLSIGVECWDSVLVFR